MITVPPAFAASTVAREGEAGRVWISALPELIEALCEKWELRIDGAAMHGYVAVVVPVVRGDTELVLKVSWIDQSSEQEPLVLRAWSGNGAVRMHESDPSAGGMLLERLDANRHLGQLEPVEAARVAGALLRRLAIPAPGELRPMDDELASLRENLTPDWESTGRPFPRALLDTALETVSHPYAGAAPVIVNTDLHYENVLAAEREPWLVIDPKALAGEPEFAVAQLLWSRSSELYTSSDLDRRLSVLTEAAELDRDRAVELTLVRLVDYWVWALKQGMSDDPAMCRRLVEWLCPRFAI